MASLQTSDGLSLQIHHWPASGRAHGTVLIVHGLGEHIGRYGHVVARLQAAGWAVGGYDQRGHGDSAGARGAIAAADSLLDDLGRVVDAVRAVPPAPLVLLGHSMGGLVAGRFVAEGLKPQPAPWWRPVDALVMSSPALDPGMSVLQKLLLALLAPLAPNLALHNGLKVDWISRDAQVVRAYAADPRVHNRVTPRLARFIVDGGAQVRALAPHWRVPTALLYAGADRCVAARGSAAFAAAAPASVLHSTCYAGLAHEIFNEPEQERVLADLLAWLVAWQDVRHAPTA